MDWQLWVLILIYGGALIGTTWYQYHELKTKFMKRENWHDNQE